MTLSVVQGHVKELSVGAMSLHVMMVRIGEYRFARERASRLQRAQRETRVGPCMILIHVGSLIFRLLQGGQGWTWVEEDAWESWVYGPSGDAKGRALAGFRIR